jgi:hypothetical protein
MDNLWQSVLASTGVAPILIGGSGLVMCLVGASYFLRGHPHKTDDIYWVTLFTIDPRLWCEFFLYVYTPEGQVLVRRGWKWFVWGLFLIVAALLIQAMFEIALII